MKRILFASTISIAIITLAFIVSRDSLPHVTSSNPGPPGLRILADRHHFSAKESISLELNLQTSTTFSSRLLDLFSAQAAISSTNRFQAEDIDIQTTLHGPDDQINSAPVTISQTETGYHFDVTPPQHFTPGSQKLEVQITRNGETTLYTQDFSWGVLALNSDQSVYEPGSTAQLNLAVLNDEGDMVCDATLNLTITPPNAPTYTLSTSDNSIIANPECRYKAVGQKPDYQSSFFLPVSGQYELQLEAITDAGTFTISDQVEAKSPLPLVIKRHGATRIYPYQAYPFTLEVIAQEDFEGSLTEYVPVSFEIQEAISSSFLIETTPHFKKLTWPVSLKAGQSQILTYTYDAPNISPEFYLLGPAQLTTTSNQVTFTETRPWQIASDTTVVYDSFTETSNTDITSHTPDTGTSWTEVYDSYTTSEAYILATTDVLKGAASVASVGQAFTAQPSATGTDQDVTFTIKNKPTVTGTRPTGAFARYTDNNNFYHVQILQNESSTNSVSLIKMVSGTATTLQSSDETIAVNDVVKLEIRDATKKVYINDIEILSDTDNSITSGTGWGLYIGNFNGAGGGTFHMRAEWELDDFTAEEPATNTAPSAPTNLLTEGATNPTTVTDFTPEFSALFIDTDDSDTAEYYQIEVNTASNFTGTVMWDSTKTALGSSVTEGNRSEDITYAGSALSQDTTYYWRIKFWDAADAEGAWSSESASFHMTSLAPTAPTDLTTNTLTNPTGLTNFTPAFRATYNDPNSGDIADFFQIEVNTNSSFTGTTVWDSTKTSMSNVTAGNTAGPFNYAGSALAQNTTYFWRIKFWDDSGVEGAWSTETASFSTLSRPPTAPTALLTEGATNPTSVKTFFPSFSAIYNDPDSGDVATSFQIEINTASDFTGTSKWDSGQLSMTGVTEGNRSHNISYGGSALDNNTTYYWRIKFWDDDNVEGAVSSTANFKVALLAQPPCSLKRNATNSAITILWNDSSTSETAWELERNVNSGGWLTLTSVGANSTSYIDSTVSAGSSYMYRVRATDGVEPSEWCTTNSLNLGTGNLNLESLNLEGVDIY